MNALNKTVQHASRAVALIGAFFALAATGGAVATAGGCGQDVPGCDSFCALPGSGPTCASDCSNLQTKCGSTYAADFQAYLTCYSNSGTFGTGECSAITATLTAECDATVTGAGSATGSGSGVSTGTVTSTPTSMGTTGGTPTSSSSIIGTSSGSPTCAELGECCGALPSTQAATCETVASEGIEAECGAELSALSSEGFCIGTTPPDTCSVGAPCADGSSCTLSGQGPCGSDVTLTCEGDGYIVSGFPCNGNVGSCGFGTTGGGSGAGCSENCECSNGQMSCAGDCPDGGLASP